MRCAEDLDEMNIEIMRNTLYKAYLDDFAAFCNKLGGTTAEVMRSLLSFEVRAASTEQSFDKLRPFSAHSDSPVCMLCSSCCSALIPCHGQTSHRSTSSTACRLG